MVELLDACIFSPAPGVGKAAYRAILPGPAATLNYMSTVLWRSRRSKSICRRIAFANIVGILAVIVMYMSEYGGNVIS